MTYRIEPSRSLPSKMTRLVRSVAPISPRMISRSVVALTATVSSSLIAVHRDPARSIFRYAAGAPDVAPYQNYGNLAARLRSPG